MSTPIVSGAAALLIEKYPDITPREIKQRIIMTADYNRQINIERLLE